MSTAADSTDQPLTQAVRQAVLSMPESLGDLLFLEAWERHRPRDLGATLRAAQIRRANPDLAAAIGRELNPRGS